MSDAPAKPATSAPQPQRSRRRKWLGRFGYALFVLVFVEISFQAFYRLTTGSFLFTRAAQPLFVEEPFGGWAVKPDLSYRQSTPEFAIDVFTNSQGFRTSREHEEFAKGRDDSRYRVLLLGPSFAFGWGVNHEQTFAAQLEGMLRKAAYAGDRRIEVINRGIPALPPGNQLNWYKNVGKDFAPDLVIQFVYASMEANLTTQASRVKDGYLVTHDPTLFQRAAGYAKNSAIVFYGWTLFTKLRGNLSQNPQQGKIEGAGRDLNVASDFEVTSPGVSASLQYYEELRTTVEGDGARLLVVYFPLSYVIHPQDMARWQHLGVQDVGKQVAFDRAFADHLNQHGTACLNVTQYLIDEAKRTGQRLYFWLDVHWTAEGNRATAQAVADWLISQPDWANRR